jgi:hypothetical protein
LPERRYSRSLDEAANGAVNDEIAAEDISGNIPGSEQIIEANYDMELAPDIHLKPCTDITLHPDQNPFDMTHPNPRDQFAWAVGAQFNLFLTRRWACRPSSGQTEIWNFVST